MNWNVSKFAFTPSTCECRWYPMKNAKVDTWCRRRVHMVSLSEIWTTLNIWEKTELDWTSRPVDLQRICLLRRKFNDLDPNVFWFFNHTHTGSHIQVTHGFTYSGQPLSVFEILCREQCGSIRSNCHYNTRFSFISIHPSTN